MSLLTKFKTLLFWKNVLKISIPFFIIVSVFSIVFRTGGALFSGDWNTVCEFHFTNNKWFRFLLQKGVISLMYGIYVANKNMK